MKYFSFLSPLKIDLRLGLRMDFSVMSHNETYKLGYGPRTTLKKIRNRYNQVPHLTQDTNGKVTISQLDTKNESQVITDLYHRYLGLVYSKMSDFQQCGILICVDSDEPVQPPFKLRNTKSCSVSSFTIIEYSRV